jgi:hypothetical protein
VRRSSVRPYQAAENPRFVSGHRFSDAELPRSQRRLQALLFAIWLFGSLLWSCVGQFTRRKSDFQRFDLIWLRMHRNRVIAHAESGSLSLHQIGF